MEGNTVGIEAWHGNWQYFPALPEGADKPLPIMSQAVDDNMEWFADDGYNEQDLECT